MIKSHHLYPFFPDLIENQRRSVQCFWEKGLLEEFELFSYILGKKKNFQMILHGSKFMLQKPKYTIQEAVRKQKSYSVSLFLPIEFKWYEESIVHQSGFKPQTKITLASAFPSGVVLPSIASAITEETSDAGKKRSDGSLRVPKTEQETAKDQSSSWIKQSKVLTETSTSNPSQIVASVQPSASVNRRSDYGRNRPSQAGVFLPAKPEAIIRESISRPFPVFLGEIPLMTERGTFLINGSARVLVNQIVRCPSVYFKVKIDHKNRRTYIASFLSDYGSWLRLETDYKSRIWVRIDKSQRVSIYALLRSLGFPESFLEYQLKYYSFLFASRETYYTEKPNEAIQYLWKKLTPGRWNSIQGCYAFLYNKFFNPRRYSIGPVGRLRLNKRLNRRSAPLLVMPEAKTRTPFFSQSRKVSVPYLPTLTPEDVFMALDLLIQLHYGEGYLDDIDHLKNRRVRLPGELIQNQFRLALSRITQIATEKISKFEIEKDLLDRRSLNIATDQFTPGSARDFGLASSLTRLGQKKVQILDSSGFLPASLLSSCKAGRKSTSSEEKVGSEPSILLSSPVPIKSFFQAQIFGSSLRELFHTSQLSQYMDQTNPLAEITHKRRLSSLGPGGIGRDQAGFAVREIHPSHFGRICPIETPEGPNAGLVGSLASYCRITENGFLQSPYFASSFFSPIKKQSSPGSIPTIPAKQGLLRLSKRASGCKEMMDTAISSESSPEPSEWFLFSADVEDESYICSENGTISPDLKGPVNNKTGILLLSPEEAASNEASLKKRDLLARSTDSQSSGDSPKVLTKLYPTRYKQEFLTVEKNQIQFFAVSPIQMISLATSLIPFLEHDDANRALMGSNMQRQAVPILFAEKPLVGTGLEIQAARDSSTTLLVKQTGQVTYVDGAEIVVESPLNRKDRKSFSGLFTNNSEVYKLQNYWRSNQNTCLRQRPQVNKGEWVEKGDLLADGSATQHGEIALGKNILLAYMPWEGYNFEDAIVINERLVQEDIYTSIHIDRYDIEIRETSYGKEKITRDLPYINPEQTRNIDPHGIIFPGTWVEEGDILVGKITPISPPKPTPEYRLLLAIFETKPLPFKETSLRVPQGVEGRVLDCIVDVAHSPYSSEKLSEQNIRKDFVPQKVQIFLAHKRKIQLGDKMSGRHGNKGIVSLILPPQDMPFLQDGTPVDIVLNPLGVPSRMNVGQVLECLFGLAGHYLKQQYRLLPFDEMYGFDASRGLVYQKLYEASCRIGYDWLFDPNSPGKSHLFDGRTGEPFHQPILVGYSYMFKLIHLVDEKMHARSTGPYSLVTQQPLGGRSKHGGQRLGEMEVWALEGFGAASILQEFLTVKSDEIYARNTFLFHLMKRRKLPRPGLPESFRVLVHELQSLCLSVYYNPDFRLTYPSLIGWDGLFLLSSKKFPTLQQLSNLRL